MNKAEQFLEKWYSLIQGEKFTEFCNDLTSLMQLPGRDEVMEQARRIDEQPDDSLGAFGGAMAMYDWLSQHREQHEANVGHLRKSGRVTQPKQVWKQPAKPQQPDNDQIEPDLTSVIPITDRDKWFAEELERRIMSKQNIDIFNRINDRCNWHLAILHELLKSEEG